MNCTAIILASGEGERFQGILPKQFTKLAGLPILVHTLKVFQQSPQINYIVVVTNERHVELVWSYATTYDFDKVVKVVCGGQTRQESSQVGLNCCAQETDYVLIHDAVRPFVNSRIISTLIDAVWEHKAVDTVIPSADTIVQIDQHGFISAIPDRSFLRRGQTPQAFDYQLIKRAHQHAEEQQVADSTDDCALVLRMKHPVYTVMGDEQNIKITYPIDLHMADKLFQLKTQSAPNMPALEITARFKDKVFVVIGGSSGIGKSLQQQLRNFSHKVYVLSRSSVPSVDITDCNSIDNAFKEITTKESRIDYIINCAGDLIRKNVEFTSIDEWDHIYDTNIKGCFLLAKCILPIFKKQNHGSLIFVGSSSYTRGRAGYAAYCSSKAALVNFCQALAEEVAQDNILVNVASPGRVNTPLRYKNFGKENPETLLDPDHVALQIVNALCQETTGSLFEIK